MKSFLATYGPRLLERGYPIIPIRPNTKHPGFKGWQKTKADRQRLKKWLANGFTQGGVGILTRDIPAVDLDVQDRAVVDRLVDWCETNIGPTVRRVGRAPKLLLVYRTDEPFHKLASNKYVDFLGQEHKVEILCDGQQFVAYAAHPDTGRPYEWVSEHDLAEIPATDLPVITIDQAKALIAYFEAHIPEDWKRVEDASASQPADPPIPESDRALYNAVPPVEISDKHVQQCLDELAGGADEYRRWVEIGMALYHQFDGSSTGLSLWDAWSANSVKYNSREIPVKWRSFRANLTQQRPITFASVIKWAKEQRKQTRTEEQRQTGFRLLHARDILAKLGPIDWQIENYLEANTTGLLFGDPGAYKSFIALDMALHVASGRPWHGNAVKHGPVIYVAGEGHGGFARRLAAWQSRHNIPLDDLPVYFSEHAAHFYDRESAVQVADAINAVTARVGKPAMIVIDTLARNFGAGDENSTADMNIFIDHVDRLLRAVYGCTVIIVHHTGHANKERARGSMALRGGVDFEYRVERAEGFSRARVICTKMKDAVEPAETWFEAETVLVGSMEDDDMASLVMVKTDAPVAEEPPLKGKQAALYGVIEQEAPVERETLREIVLNEGIFQTSDQFKNALQQLKKKDLIIENDKYINTVDAFYSAGDLPEKTEISGGENGNLRHGSKKGVSH